MMKRYAACLLLLIGLLFAQAASAQDIVQIANEGTTGTAVNKIAKLTGAPSTAITATTADIDGAVGIVVSGAGTTGNAYVAVLGTPSCVFDGATTAGDYVIISTLVAGNCHDGGVTRPASVQVLGRVLTTNAAGGTYQIKLEPNFSGTGGGGSVCGVNGQLLYNNAGVCGGLTVSSGLSVTGGAIMIPGGGVSNTMLANSSITINTHATALGSSVTLAFSDFAGTIAASQCPNPAATTLGCIESFAAVTNQWIDSISTAGVPHASQPNFSNLAGNIAVTQMNSGTGASSTTCWFGDATWKNCGASSASGAGVQGSQAVQGYGDVNQNPMASGHYIYFTNAAFTAARTWTLPASATQGQGLIIIYDKQRTLTATNSLTVCAAGTDSIDGGGAASCTNPIKTAGAAIVLQNDGAGKFATVVSNLIGTCAAGTNQFMTGIDVSGVCQFVQPSIGNISGLGTGVATAAGNNLSAAGGLTTTIASGTAALGTSAIASGACAAAITVAATNTATTDVVAASFNGDPTAVTGYIPATTGMLTIIAYPTANNVNFKVCNNTSASITPGAITLNWRVTR